MDGRILLVDDEKDIVDLLENVLTEEGFSLIQKAYTGTEAIRLCREYNPDIVILDIMLPDLDGLEVCRKIREFSYCSILFLSSRNDDIDKILGLACGGDDYITKPFRPLVLGAKVKALIRRNKNLVLDNSDTLECGPFSYDTTTMRFYKNGEELILSSKESALLLLFMKNPQQVFTKDMIYEHVWGNTVAVDDNAIMVYINRLRGKIEDDRQNPAYILTIRGLGYRFVP